MGSVYAYKPLRDPQSGIRLLSITSSDNDEISVSLREIESLKAGTYHCLSYTWGPPLPEVQITVDSHPWRSRPNLYSALKHLHQVLPDKMQTIWIDAICINQGNETEKGAQIKRMHDIYAGAESVIVWLGSDIRGQDPTVLIPRFESVADKIDASFDGVHGLDFWNLINKLNDRDMIAPISLDAYPLIRDIAVDDWFAVHDLVYVEYFRRQWIWQEIVAATARPIVVCGGHVLSSWEALRKVSHALHLFGIKAIVQARRAGERNVHLDPGMTTVNMPHQLAYSRDVYREEGGKQSMRAQFGPIVLQRHRDSFLCWDERDRLFAMVGICGFEKLAGWDYSRPFRELYIHFWSSVMSRTQTVNYLSFVEDASAREDRPRMSRDANERFYDAELPSWVPDLRTPLEPPSMWSFYHNIDWLNISKGLPGTKGFKTESLTVDEEKSTLKFKAYLLDTIQSSGHTAIEILQVLRDILRDISTDDDSHEGAIGAVWGALAFLSEYVENVTAGISQAMINKARLWLLQSSHLLPLNSSSVPQSSRELLDEVVSLDTTNLIVPLPPSSGESYNLLSTMDKEAITLGMKRMRIFRTRNHWIGKGSLSLQRGDQVWIVPGAVMGFILRPLEEGRLGTHEFVGQAYVVGASGGELCEELLAKGTAEVVLV